MAILKLYGSARTTSTRRVATVPFELVEVDIRNGEHKTPAYLERQPFGLIPYIVRLYYIHCGCAICRYIAAKYPGCRLVPTGLQENALFEQAASVELTSFDHGRMGDSCEGVRVPRLRLGLKTDQAVVDQEIATLDKKLAAYDVILGKRKYLAGDELTLADLFHLPDVMTRRRNVARWYSELISRPSWRTFEYGVKTTLEH
ncbi:glutathione S-transferase [Mycena maculata]|uniref:glutathione transferase n=1 Tax=Mycena maculata TaxID=230809 RepID=A0AAD7HHL4_9AGAR|nr:glutathione S-transferase [Mycena maculata]